MVSIYLSKNKELLKYLHKIQIKSKNNIYERYIDMCRMIQISIYFRVFLLDRNEQYLEVSDYDIKVIDELFYCIFDKIQPSNYEVILLMDKWMIDISDFIDSKTIIKFIHLSEDIRSLYSVVYKNDKYIEKFSDIRLFKILMKDTSNHKNIRDYLSWAISLKDKESIEFLYPYHHNVCSILGSRMDLNYLGIASTDMEYLKYLLKFEYINTSSSIFFHFTNLLKSSLFNL